MHTYTCNVPARWLRRACSAYPAPPQPSAPETQRSTAYEANDSKI